MNTDSNAVKNRCDPCFAAFASDALKLTAEIAEVAEKTFNPKERKDRAKIAKGYSKIKKCLELTFPLDLNS